MKRTILQVSRYAVVGLTSNAVGYLLYLLLTDLGLGPKLTMSMLYGVGVLQTFLFNKRWTFGHQGRNGAVFIRYCMAYGLGYVINLFALMILVDHLGYPHQIVQGMMIFLVAAMLFLAQRYWVFAQIPGSDAA